MTKYDFWYLDLEKGKVLCDQDLSWEEVLATVRGINTTNRYAHAEVVKHGATPTQAYRVVSGEEITRRLRKLLASM